MRIRARYLHHVEVAADMLSGYLFNLLLFSIVYNWLFGNDVHIAQNAGGGLIFMFFSYWRKYFWRRFFSNKIKKIYELQEQTGKE